MLLMLVPLLEQQRLMVFALGWGFDKAISRFRFVPYEIWWLPVMMMTTWMTDVLTVLVLDLVLDLVGRFR